MAYPIIRPNLHVILIHYPLGILIAGTLIELFAFLWRRSSLRAAGRWMILIGALSAVPATYSGIYAMRDVASRSNPTTDGPWVTVKATSPLLSQPDIWHVLQRHMLFQSVSTAICVLVVVVWLGRSDEGRQSLHAPLMALLLVGVGGIIGGAWFGGEAVYHHAVSVDVRTDKAETAPAPTYPFENYISPVELHILSAGTMVAIALAAIGLSFRKISATFELGENPPLVARDEIRGVKTLTPADPMAVLRSFNPEFELTNNPFAPAARFWILAFVLGLITVGGGLFVTFGDANVFETARTHHQQIWAVAWDQIKPGNGQKINRFITHLAAGLVLVLTPLVLAGLTRYAPKRRLWLSLLTLVLVAAVAVQLWIGILLLFDTPDGPVTRFQTAAATR